MCDRSAPPGETTTIPNWTTDTAGPVGIGRRAVLRSGLMIAGAAAFAPTFARAMAITPPPTPLIDLDFVGQPLATLAASGLVASNSAGCWDELGNPVPPDTPNLSPQGYGLWSGPTRVQYLTDPGNPTSANWPGGAQTVALTAGTYVITCCAPDNSGVVVSRAGFASFTVYTDCPGLVILTAAANVTFQQVCVDSNNKPLTPNLTWINCQGADTELSPILAPAPGTAGSDGVVSVPLSGFNNTASSAILDFWSGSVQACNVYAISDGVNYAPRIAIQNTLLSATWGTASVTRVSAAVTQSLTNVLGYSGTSGAWWVVMDGGEHATSKTTAFTPPAGSYTLYPGSGGPLGSAMPGRFRRIRNWGSAQAPVQLYAETAPIFVYMIGDSQTLGAGAGTFRSQRMNWGWQTYRKFAKAGFRAVVDGYTGRGLIAPASPAPLSSPATCAALDATVVPGLNNILCPFIGINDLSHGVTGLALYNALIAYLQNRINAGWNGFLIWTLPPGYNIPEAQRQGSGVGFSFNDTLRWAYANPGQTPAGANGPLPSSAYTLVDVGADPVIGQAGQNKNMMYYGTDFLHWTSWGMRYVARNLFAPALNTLLP